jgi:hypothetical protein
MRRLRLERFLVGAALVAAAVVSGPVARAADAPAGSTGAASSDAKKDDKPEPPIFDIFGDLVVGSAQATQVTGVVPPGTTGGIAGQSTIGTSKVTDWSLILGGGLNITSGFLLGMRLPLEGGTIFANPTRSDGGVGNFEVSGKGLVNLAEQLNLELTLGVTIPTAGGHQIPAPGTPVPVVQGAIDQSGYDRYTALRASSMSRGYEDDELFQPDHLGFNPKISLAIGTVGKWNVTPWVKMDNLVATNSSYSYIGEFLFGVNIGGYLLPAVEPVIRAWANVPFTGADFSSVSAAVEPQIRFHIGDVTPYLGGILPIAGSTITNPYAFGVRIGIAARF